MTVEHLTESPKKGLQAILLELRSVLLRLSIVYKEKDSNERDLHVVGFVGIKRDTI